MPVSPDLNLAACTIGLIICAAGVVATFMSRIWSALVCFVGFATVYFWGGTELSASQFFFWGAAAVMAWGICYMLPKPVALSRVGVGYIAGATLAGALVGMIVSAAGLIIGAVVGAFCGALAYSRTPSGAILEFPSSKFLHYLCAKGLPAVVDMCIFCLALMAVFAF